MPFHFLFEIDLEPPSLAFFFLPTLSCWDNAQLFKVSGIVLPPGSATSGSPSL